MANRQAFSRSSGLPILAAALFAIHANHAIAATSTFTGPWGGGTIAPGDVVVLNNGASVTGNVVANGTLRFNQSTPSLLTISSTISGTGALSLTNTGTVNLTGTSVSANTVVLNLTTTSSAGLLQIRSGTGELRVGSSGTGTLNVTGGGVTNSVCYLGYNAGSVGTATVSSGTWANSSILYVGYSGTGTLNVTGGSVTSSSLIILGYNAGSVGTATVSNGQWENYALYVGWSGVGALHFAGGSVANADSYLGWNAGSVGTATVSGGTLANYALNVGYSGTGTLNITGGSVTNVDGELGYNAGSVGTATVSGGTWANSRYFTVGRFGTGTLNISGGQVTTSSECILGYNAGSVGTATVSSGMWANSSILYVGYSGTGTLNITGGSVTNSFSSLGSNAGSVGIATVSSGTWTSRGGMNVGYSGTGTLNVTGGQVTNVNGELGYNAGSVGTATVSGGTWANSSSLYVGYSGTGTLNITGGSVTNVRGSLGVEAGSVGTAMITGGTWANSGNLTVGISGTGELTMSGGLVTVGGTLSTGTYGTMNLNPGGRLQIGIGGTAGMLDTNLKNNGSLIFNRSDSSTCSVVISGTGSIVNAGTGTTTLTVATSYIAPLAATAGRLIVGDGSSVAGFATVSNLSAGSSATLELRSRGLAYVNGLSTLTGGTIRAANGISLGAGANVLGTGAISGDVSGVYGSRIEADGGKLTLGNALSYVGFASDGRLYTNANEVELLDRNLAVLGSLTQLGTGVSGGSLRAVNGMLLEQGKNLVGRGTVYGDFVNQGDVYGDGAGSGQQLVFAAGSTVSGNGSFTNALFNGTYAPGNSPAITNLTNGALGSTSTLLIEIGGTQAGAQYDQVQNVGTLSLLGGTLNVVLTNSFMPAPGDSFQILGYDLLAGDFGALNLPVFDNGLGWQRLTTGTSMRLVATPLPVTIDVATGSETLAASGYSSLAYAASLSKTGTGTLILNAADTFAGATSIQQGILAITSAAAISSSPLVSLASGASFDVSGLSGGYTVPSGQTIAGSGTVLGSVTFGRGSTLSPGMFSAAFGASMLAADMQAGSLQALVVPEPASLGMVGVGLGVLGLRAVRRKRAA